MHSNIYSFLFRAANIKEENIIDSHAAWNEANISSLQIKERKTHLLFVFYNKIKCYNKSNKAYWAYWVAYVLQWIDLKMLHIISKHLYHN